MGRLRTPAREGAPAARRSRPRMAEAGSRQWHPCKPRSIWRAACPGSCQSCFCGLWFAEPARQVAVGAARASSPDRDRFESIYARALKAAGELDPVVCRAFDQFAKYSWKEPPSSHADECVWEFFYGASGRNTAGWVEIACGVNYRAAASRQNGALTNAYRISYDAASKAAARTAVHLRKTGR
ncbi:MAG: hypothetical protein IS632_03980 [Thaumarchaeota archaeon]|nr:hypothetical protein [Nitrososphaerota archaeon]